MSKELMITDLSVVNDARTAGPNGPWSFGGLMTEMAGTTPPGRFVVDWLKTWEADQTANTFVVDKRTAIRTQVIDPWKQKDGQAGVSDDTWNPKLQNAPFRLLAIVNRIDLNHGTATQVTDAGEGRFVFGVLDASGNPLRFTVIFEYEQVAKTRERLRGWAQQWHALGSLTFGATYNGELQKITDRFSKKGNAPAKPNQSALNQIRTNEIALATPWELREFHINAAGGLQLVTVRQTPDEGVQNSPRLTKLINDNEAAILDRTFEIPDSFDGSPLKAARAPVPFGFFWQAPGTVNNEARHLVAKNACNGCHHRETNTVDFLHVKPRAANAEAQLSGFLTGITVQDPVKPAVSRQFHDLSDRAQIMKDLTSEPGAIQLQAIKRDRRNRVH